MLPNTCCCCFKSTEDLLSIKIKSSQTDGKTLLDYLNSVFRLHCKEYQASDWICLRCSKALQVAYHFINMVIKSKESAHHNNRRERFQNISHSEKQPKVQDKQDFTHLEECYNENDQNAGPLHVTGSLKIFRKDAGSSLISKAPNSGYICNICNTSYDDKISFVEHNRQKHKEIIPYKCKLCSFYTCYAESLFKHCEKNHGINDVALDLYQNKEVLQKVDENPEFAITYSCISCSFESSCQAAIDEHLLSEHSMYADKELFVKKLFSCPACCRHFLSLKAAKIHYSMYHNCSLRKNNVYKKRKFCCEKCGKFFDLKSGLVLHRLACKKRKIVNCNFCSLEFSSVLKYERHLQDIHCVSIKHECETCSKTFNCSEYLAVHRKRHNERNFQCDLCPKNYINNAELKVHKQRIHEIKHAALKYRETKTREARLLRYDVCDFVSSSSSALKIHTFNHTGKRYSCHFCKKEFAIRVLFRQHLKRHHSLSVTNEVKANTFSEQNNSLEITEVNETKLKNEKEEFGLSLEKIIDDLFNQD